MRKRLLSVLLTFAMVLTLLPGTAWAATSNDQFAGGDGAEQNPYQIATANQLNAVRNELSAHYILVNDIDLDGDVWDPIGTSNDPFTGSFNGSGYTIFHLTSGYTPNSNYAGLFGYCTNAYICNVNLKECTINSTLSDRGVNAGGIVGSLDKESKIEGCTYDGNIQIFITGSYGSIVGGIVGWSQGEIVSCTNYSDINVSGVYGYESVAGGIVGSAYAAIQNCKNYGDVSTYYYAGGIVGEYGTRYGSETTLRATLSNCTNYGNVSAREDAGGIAGTVRYKDIVDSTNYGEISISDARSSNSWYPETGYYAGGIVGRATNVNVNKCTNIGEIYSNYYGAWAAGIVAHAAGESQIYLCANTANVYSSAGTSYNSFAAGIVASATDTTEISQCYNSGEISSYTQHMSDWFDTAPSASAYSGGISAFIQDSSTIENCYNTGKIMAQSHYGGYGGYYPSHGYAHSGGIVGRDVGSVTNCYNLGPIYTFEADYCYEGAIAGSTYDGIEIKNCYYIDDVNVSAVGDTNVTLSSVSGCTDSQLMQQSTYVGFDFSQIWYFNTQDSYPYPQLQGLESAGQVPGDGSILAVFPANGATNVGYDAANPPSFSITFDRDIASGEQEYLPDIDLDSPGALKIYRAADDKLIYPDPDTYHWYSIYDFGMVYGNKNILTLAPTNRHTLLEPDTAYYITMGERFITFADGTTNPAIKKGEWVFTTRKDPKKIRLKREPSSFYQKNLAGMIRP